MREERYIMRITVQGPRKVYIMKRHTDHAILAGTPRTDSTRGTVVVAEDDVATRRLLRQILEHSGFTVYAVKNGKLACEAVRARHPDVILLDWMMPVMDGLRAAGALKADVATRAIPIVMITTHSQIEDRHLALNAGVQDFVTKPFEAEELVRCVDQQMRWRSIISGTRAVDARTPFAADAGIVGGSC